MQQLTVGGDEAQLWPVAVLSFMRVGQLYGADDLVALRKPDDLLVILAAQLVHHPLHHSSAGA